MKKVTKTSLLADLALFVMAFIWGSGFVFMKSSLDNYTAVQIITIRMLIGAVVLGLFSLKRLVKMKPGDILAGFLISVSLFLGFLFQTLGLQTTTAGNSAFLTAIYVILVPIMASVFAKQKPTKYNVFSAILMLIGIFLLTADFGTSWISLGNIYTIICAVFFSAQVLLIDYYTLKHDPVVLAVLQMFFASVIGFVIMLFTDTWQVTFPQETISTILYLGVVASGVTYLIQNVAQKYTSPTHAGVLMSLESVFGCMLGILLLNEVMTERIAIGAGIIFLAIIITETKLNFLKSKKKRAVVCGQSGTDGQSCDEI